MSDMEHSQSGSIVASAKSHLSDLIPLALDKLKSAITKGESWAIKLLLEAAAFERIAQQVLEERASNKAGPIISTAFERHLVERVLRVFRGEVAEKGDSEDDQD